MMMIRAIATVAVVFIAVAIVVGSAGAQTGVGEQSSTGGVLTPTVDYSFGQHITFRLEASSQTTITQANLFFRVQGQTDTTAVSVPLEPGMTIFVEHSHSPLGQNIPPFATITYWWEVHYETGSSQRSEEELLYYADNRYDWNELVDPREDINLVAYWSKEGGNDVDFGQAALNVATKALSEISQELGVSVPGDVKIYLYPSEEDLRSALNLGGYNWAGGQARPELGAVLVGIPRGPAALGEMERLIPHELTHLLVYEATGRVLGRVPPWLNEGLASLNERRPDPNREALVEQALAEDRLIPLEALCAPFPLDQSDARLAYAQSATFVQYLRRERGSQVVRDLLAAYGDQAECDEGVIRVLGKSLQELDLAWRADLTGPGQSSEALDDNAVWLMLWGLTFLLVLPLFGVVRRNIR